MVVKDFCVSCVGFVRIVPHKLVFYANIWRVLLSLEVENTLINQLSG